jgi:hypothetical protein
VTNKFAVAGPNSKYAAPEAEPAGFWAGFWHGMIAPIAFVVSLFDEGVSIYEVNNNGLWYNFGFVLGVLSAAGRGSGVHLEGDDSDARDEDGEDQ